jgi:hypothetical protein
MDTWPTNLSKCNPQNIGYILTGMGAIGIRNGYHESEMVHQRQIVWNVLKWFNISEMNLSFWTVKHPITLLGYLMTWLVPVSRAKDHWKSMCVVGDAASFSKTKPEVGHSQSGQGACPMGEGND